MASDPSPVDASLSQASPEEQPDAQVSDSAKRKAEQPNGTQTRSKRNRYISIACNECKRRKIKCNGQVPCQRCGHLKLECRYAPNCCNNNFKDSDEFRSMKDQITALQDQVSNLFNSINELRVHKSTFDTQALDSFSRDGAQVFTPMQPPPSKPRIRHPRFHGPTSSAFNFDVARSSLQHMGIAPAEEVIPDDLTTAHVTPAASPPQMLPLNQQTMHPAKDPLWLIKREEALRLCRVYEEEIGIMYPLVEIEQITHQVNLLYTFMEAAMRTGLMNGVRPGADGLEDDSSSLIKLVLATTLIVEGGGRSELGQRLYLSAKPVIESKIWDALDIKTIQLLGLMATYHFHTDEDALAYRIIGMAARMCLEMGLHKRDALVKAFPNDAQWPEIVKIFWAIYSLDRRWSFGTGLPFVIQDEDIDPNLPDPVRYTSTAGIVHAYRKQDPSLPYLKCMITYNRISSKVWYSGLGSDGTTDIRRDEIGYLDYQVLQWYKQVPETLKYYPSETPRQSETANRGLRRLRILLYLRMNQLRILIYRPVLHSATSIAEDKGHAQTVVDVAKDTVRILTRLNQTSDIYRTQQITFNYFLVAALGVLFLAVCHAPNEFNRQVRDEFYQALDLVNTFSTKSYVSKRLWKTIKGLRKIGERLGVILRPFGTDNNDPHSTAAVAMAGLAGHPIEDLSVYGPMNGVNELGNSPLNGLQMSHELTNLFEAVGGFGNFMASTATDGINEFVGPEGELQNTGEGLSGILGDEGEFARVIRELF
ncbi:fungal-specific transcription factor domain-containing protein [Aspergillus karnatakaensis]|uniref:transcription factor domain-containing protein n=1 Tax=Aspergillus karnatakaensis TaxID=1810916 RepID=UPI003CCD0CE6